MHSTLTLAFKYFNYYLKASNGKGHGIHSPFVYHWVREVLNNPSSPHNVKEIEGFRQHLKANKSSIEVLDLGAGSRQTKLKTRRVDVIAKSALKSSKIAALLYRMVRYHKPHTILEMGTSFGITSCYLAAGNSRVKLVTMEGAPSVVQIAEENFKLLDYKNIELRQGDFAQLLPTYINEIESVGLVYIDGNHQYQPTLEYFEILLGKVNEQSVLIFDDIYWSSEMEQAWSEIKKHPKVTLTIDLFFIGIVFFRNENKQKEHFMIRY